MLNNNDNIYNNNNNISVGSNSQRQSSQITLSFV